MRSFQRARPRSSTTLLKIRPTWARNSSRRRESCTSLLISITTSSDAWSSTMCSRTPSCSRHSSKIKSPTWLSSSRSAEYPTRPASRPSWRSCKRKSEIRNLPVREWASRANWAATKTVQSAVGETLKRNLEQVASNQRTIQILRKSSNKIRVRRIRRYSTKWSVTYCTNTCNSSTKRKSTRSRRSKACRNTSSTTFLATRGSCSKTQSQIKTGRPSFSSRARTLFA